MRRLGKFIGLALIASLVAAPSAFAKREKFGADKRHQEVQKELRTIKPSTETFRWKMVMPWSKGLLFYDMAQHFADSVKLASGGRLDIKLFSAGELVGAMESFDAVSKGSADIGHDWPGYWMGKNQNFNSFASVPFGLDYEGYNIWLYERGGLEQMQELYAQYNLYALPGGNGGQEMGLFSNKKATTMADFKGMRVRTPGWFMDILNNLGASVTPLPGGEVYLALERGVIDAAEFSSPAINYPMGFDEITKYVIEPGVHQPSVQCGLFINMDSWNKLPADLQWIVKMAAKETQLWSNAWQENLNIEAIKLFKESVEFVKMDDEAITEFAKVTKAYLDEVKAKYPDVKKTLDSQEQFKRDFAEWREIRSGITPWPIDDFIDGKRMQ
ncbi:TRAP transporter substrate-binding protein [Desulfopila inferna]|uniref:TRAP transporter substrate-binding protein n=1 Tax=Desulfopila inferna TaxID=468528 RepID=UPI001965FE2D|nr:TRAP transporter substrate-binding protein DctP [Desulfopila inferna]MBM9603316.1 TRAP transporter substrate-binding protein DctP [Desulfopila inferna]